MQFSQFYYTTELQRLADQLIIEINRKEKQEINH